MTELIMKMLMCLLGAMVLGFIFGYLISKVLGKKKYTKEIEELKRGLNQVKKENTLLTDESKKLQVSLMEAKEINSQDIKLSNVEVKTPEIDGDSKGNIAGKIALAGGAIAGIKGAFDKVAETKIPDIKIPDVEIPKIKVDGLKDIIEKVIDSDKKVENNKEDLQDIKEKE